MRERMAPELPAGLAAHIERVVSLAGDFARRHGADEERTLLTAQAHDVLRALDGPTLLALAEERGLDIDPVERAEPVLLHGPLGALELRERFGIRDERVLHAVRWHTSGHPDYDREAWAFFVADKVEPSKLARWPELEAVVDIADGSLEAAALAYLDLSVERGRDEGWRVHPMAQLTREALRARVGGAR